MSQPTCQPQRGGRRNSQSARGKANLHTSRPASEPCPYRAVAVSPVGLAGPVRPDAKHRLASKFSAFPVPSTGPCMTFK